MSILTTTIRRAGRGFPGRGFTARVPVSRPIRSAPSAPAARVPAIALLAAAGLLVALAPVAALAADRAGRAGQDDRAGQAREAGQAEPGAGGDAALRVAAALAKVDDGRTVRVLLRGGTLLEAPYAGWDGRHLLLMQPAGPLPVPADDVEALWKQGRRTGGGAKLGAIVGGIGGAGFFTFLALMIQELGDGDPSIAAAALFGGLAGAGGGAIVGAVAGSAIPRWELLLGDEETAAARAGAAGSAAGDGAEATAAGGAGGRPAAGGRLATMPLRRRGMIGSLGLAAGGAWAEGSGLEDAALGFNLDLVTELRWGLGLGFEFGSYRLAAPRPAWLEPDSPYRVADSVWHLGGLVRYAFGGGPLRPYLVAGLAGYNWEESFFGGSVGAGLEFDLIDERDGRTDTGRALDGLAARIEFRRHDNLQNLVGSDPGFSVVLAGVRWAW